MMQNDGGDSMNPMMMAMMFGGGRGGTAISNLIKGSYPYDALIQDIQKSYDEARNKGMEFIVPAVCWMQGESDMFDYTRVDYRKLICQFAADVNRVIQAFRYERTGIPRYLSEY